MRILWNRFIRYRSRTPTLLQMEAVECGAAALGMIMRRYGLWIPLERLRVECGVSRDGSKASNILKAARKFGFECKGLRREPEALRELSFPCIIFWNFNHFVVLEGFGRGVVFINDPAVGPREISPEEFDQSFTGVVLVVEPGPNFKRQGKKPRLINKLVPRLRYARSGVALIVLAGIALIIPGMIIPTFSAIFIDNILVSRMDWWLMPLLTGMIITAVLRAALTALQETYLMRLETRLALAESSRFFWHVLRLPIEFFGQRFGGEIGTRVALNDNVATLLSKDLASNTINLLLIVFYALLMYQYDWVLTVTGITIAALNFLFLRSVSRRRVDDNQRLLQDRGKLMGTAMNGLQLIETIKATGSETDFFSRWAGYQAKVLNAEQKLAVTNAYLMAVPIFLTSVNTALILGIGGLRVMEGAISMGMLVAFQSLMQSFIAPVNETVNLGSKLQEMQGDLIRIDDVLNYEPDPKAAAELLDENKDVGHASDQAKLAGNLQIHNLQFGYSRLETPLIDAFDLELTPGARVALVGGSGSGKSTIAKVVAGLYEAWEGEILFDGQARDTIDPRLFNNSMAMVDQEIALFEGSIKDNLTMWDNSIPLDRVIQAARDACIHKEIAARSGGYEFLLGEGGRNLSGGQRQRIEIARALVGDPSILIMDEATSALDPMTEKAVDRNIRRRGCTCLIVAHRLSTIRDCDEIIVLHRGSVLERGTHEQLVALQNHYFRLIQE